MSDEDNNGLDYGFESEGDWQNEAESVAYLKEVLQKTGLFTIYNEVEGRIIQPRPFCEEKGVRIDMVLSPTSKLNKAGWKSGCIGIECKKSGIKINHAFAQAQDYSRTVWRLKSGFLLMCEYSFVWPFPKTHGFLASIMAQNKIGTIQNTDHSEWGCLKFYCGENKVLKYYHSTGIAEIGACFGNKAGSR